MQSNVSFALDNSKRVKVKVINNEQAEKAIFEGMDHWISSHQNQEWHVISVGLSLLTNWTYAEQGSKMTKVKELGILQRYNFQGFTRPNLLFIYSSDNYTESWVHETATSLTAAANSSRILNIQRDDPGEAIDLGNFSLS